VPGDPAHVMYVWVDALTNYLTGAGFPDVESKSYQRYWPADLHIIGKDITRFHAVYWPAFLMSAGLPLPKRVFAHGFVNIKGEKMSKSVGNVVDPVDIVAQFGLDAVRFFLLREISYGQDGNYSHEAIVTRINADLANEYGNLAQRSLSMVAKNLDGIVPTPGEFTADDTALLAQADDLYAKCKEHFDVQALHLAVEALWAMLAETNRYFSAQQPWVLRKTDPERMATVLYVTLEVVRQVTILVQPVMPDSAAKLLDLLGARESERSFAALQDRLQPGRSLPAPSGVFPRYVEAE
jgi:methionyl-tRNA synthetase